MMDAAIPMQVPGWPEFGGFPRDLLSHAAGSASAGGILADGSRDLWMQGSRT